MVRVGAEVGLHPAWRHWPTAGRRRVYMRYGTEAVERIASEIETWGRARGEVVGRAWRPD